MNTENEIMSSNYTETDRMRYTEHVDVSACKYLASLTFEQFKSGFCTGDWKDNDGDKIANDVRVYHRQVKTFCGQMAKSSGANPLVYKYGKNRSSGRIYTEQFGIQRLSKPLRDMLVPKTMVDYDIQNCHPTILLHLAKCYELPAHYLEEYVTDREAGR